MLANANPTNVGRIEIIINYDIMQNVWSRLAFRKNALMTHFGESKKDRLSFDLNLLKFYEAAL